MHGHDQMQKMLQQYCDKAVHLGAYLYRRIAFTLQELLQWEAAHIIYANV